jgi:hypothetical protein
VYCSFVSELRFCKTELHRMQTFVINIEFLLVEQELLTLPEHLSSSSIFSGVGVTPYLVICVFFVDRCLSFCTFCFGHFTSVGGLFISDCLSVFYVYLTLPPFNDSACTNLGK